MASQPNLLSQDHGDLWDSGKVDSDQSIQLDYGGQELKSQMFCYWKVRAWDKDGKQRRGGTKPAMRSMGLLAPGGLDSQMDRAGRRNRGKGKRMRQRRLPARMIRHDFQAESRVARATVYVAGWASRSCT